MSIQSSTTVATILLFIQLIITSSRALPIIDAEQLQESAHFHPGIPDVAAHAPHVVHHVHTHVYTIPAFVLPKHPPALPLYYMFPHQYFRRQSNGYYWNPGYRSRLFELDPNALNYLDNLLPTFKQEKTDPKKAPDTPTTQNQPPWMQQASRWVWPDDVETGTLPTTQFGFQPNTAPQFKSRTEKHARLQENSPPNPFPVDIAVVTRVMDEPTVL